MAKAASIGPSGGLRGFPVNTAGYVHDKVINSAIHPLGKCPAPFPNTRVQVSGIKEATEAGLPEEVGSAILDYVARRTPPGLPAHDLRVTIGGV
ncbi:hypothetical protein FRC00_008463 [Tulasnella sp. 408]|nr:hypothetical protein FRC00_008463 [Tulasnella sp. 408]